MILMMLKPGHPIMHRIASLRFNIVPFFFLLAGYYLPLSSAQVKSALKIFRFMVLAVIVFGIFETFFLSDQFFLDHIHIAAFKTGTHETGTDPNIGSYLYSPGFMHRRRMVSLFLSATASGHFLSFALCLLLAEKYTGTGLKNTFLHVCMILLIISGIFLSTSRLSMSEAFVIGMVFTMMSDLNRRLQYLGAGLLAAGAVMVFYGGSILNVAAMTISGSDASTVKHMESIFTASLRFLGRGLGEAANVFADESAYTGGEGIFNRLMLETGLTGFAMFAFAYTSLVFSAFQESRKYPGGSKPDAGAGEKETRRIAKAICLTGAVYLPVMIPSVFITVNLFSTVSHGIFWLILGMGFRLAFMSENLPGNSKESFL